MLRIFTTACLFMLMAASHAQSSLKLFFREEGTMQAIPGVTISKAGKAVLTSDRSGKASIMLDNGTHMLSFSAMNYETLAVKFFLPDSSLHEIILRPVQQTLETITVSSTRNNQKIESAPLKVEVLGREEMEEENSIQPKSIASILGDVSGIQIQQSSVVNANSNVRIQGLEGRYTQILRDGMPLFEGFSSDFGILSTPPLDLKQIELIKGSASTLYGGGAIGGLINIISRKPSANQEGTITLNHTSMHETNLNSFFSRRYKQIGYTFFSGLSTQKPRDTNKDGFSEVPGMNNLVLHPRLFFYPNDKTTIITGYTATFEKRKGGDMFVLNNQADALHQFFQKDQTARHSGTFTVERNLVGNKKLEFKSSLSAFDKKTITNKSRFTGNQLDYFTELSVLVPYASNSLVGGMNVTGNRFKKLAGDPILIPDFSNTTVGAFVQNTWSIGDATTFEAGLRDDYTNRYGNFFLPRVAIFRHLNDHWGARAGIGMGYKIPDPFSPRVSDFPVESMEPLPPGIRAERSIGYNAEVNYKKEWTNGNQFFINHAFFLTKISDPVIVSEQYNGTAAFSNASKPIITKGFDTYIQAVVSHWEMYLGYTYTLAERKYLTTRQFMPLTPRNRAAFTLVKSIEKAGWRFGLEGSFNGRQYRFDGTMTPSYYFAAGMIEKKFGEHLSIVLNGENLLNYKMSNVEPLSSGSITNPDFKPLWAPVDGRVINLSVRIRPFKN